MVSAAVSVSEKESFFLGLAMKDIYELLRQKEREISRLETEVEALRVAAPLLSNEEEVGDDNQPTSDRSTLTQRPGRIPQAVDANPQPEHAAE